MSPEKDCVGCVRIHPDSMLGDGMFTCQVSYTRTCFRPFAASSSVGFPEHKARVLSLRNNLSHVPAHVAFRCVWHSTCFDLGDLTIIDTLNTKLDRLEYNLSTPCASAILETEKVGERQILYIIHVYIYIYIIRIHTCDFYIRAVLPLLPMPLRPENLELKRPSGLS